MLAGRNSHRDLVLANQVIGHAYVVEIVHLDHEVVDSAIAARDYEGNRVVAFVAVHENQPDGALAAAKLVLDAAAHSELSVKALGRVDVALSHDTVPESARARLEPPMHRAAGMERLAELSQRAVIDLDRIAVGVIELEDFEHPALVSFVFGTDAKLYSRFGELALHL